MARSEHHWLITHNYGTFSRMPLCWATPEQVKDPETTISRPVLNWPGKDGVTDCPRCKDAADKVGVQ